mmetsp:Transcript_24353/g.61704  ORF Transcript_24353/g.61704 Transcript_24353/m.61704 type:complete len:274 (+) Transcript_24353:887-1708(+)
MSRLELRVSRGRARVVRHVFKWKQRRGNALGRNAPRAQRASPCEAGRLAVGPLPPAVEAVLPRAAFGVWAVHPAEQAAVGLHLPPAELHRDDDKLLALGRKRSAARTSALVRLRGRQQLANLVLVCPVCARHLHAQGVARDEGEAREERLEALGGRGGLAVVVAHHGERTGHFGRALQQQHGRRVAALLGAQRSHARRDKRRPCLDRDQHLPPGRLCRRNLCAFFSGPRRHPAERGGGYIRSAVFRFVSYRIQHRYIAIQLMYRVSRFTAPGT